MKNHEASAQAHNEHDFEEVMDISHLPKEEQASVEEIFDLVNTRQVDMPDDTTIRAACHGYILSKLGYDISDPDYNDIKRELSPEKKAEILCVLKKRFEANKEFHEGLDWAMIETALATNDNALWSVAELEKAGHAPDVTFSDRFGFSIGSCWEKEPKGPYQTMCSYDEAAEMAHNMGLDLMHPIDYIHLQEIRNKIYDHKTSCWLKTNEEVRKTHHAYCGHINGYGQIEASRFYVHNRMSDRSWRGTIKVLWAE